VAKETTAAPTATPAIAPGPILLPPPCLGPGCSVVGWVGTLSVRVEVEDSSGGDDVVEVDEVDEVLVGGLGV
jgi:hypothetical protein